MKKKILSLFLTLVMISSLFAGLTFTASAQSISDFPDMPDKGSWSYDALSSAVDNGLLNGSNGKLMPNDILTRAQLAAIINRSFGAECTEDINQFKDVAAGSWYYNDIAKAVRMGTFKGDGNSMRPDAAISRQEAFVVLARAVKLEAENINVLDKFSDKSDVSGWAAPLLSAMVKSGYVNGNNGKIKPLNTISRAEFAQVMYNLIKSYCNESKSYSEISLGNIMVNTEGVILKDVTVSGDLIIGEGVGNGEVTLDGVIVTGRMVVRGGGENSVILKNKSIVGSVLVGKTGDGGVRIRTEEGCRIEALVIDDGKDDIILEGEFNQVAVATDTPVILRDADITGLTVKAEKANVSMNGETKVTNVQISENAAGSSIAVSKTAEVINVISKAEKVSVSGEGTVKSVEVSGNDTAINTKGTSVEVSTEAKGVTQNGNSIESGKKVDTGKEETSGGGGSGGGESGSGSSGGGSVEHSHSWDAGVVTTQPICTTEGVRTYSCTSCKQTKTEIIEALGHKWDEGIVTTPRTAETDGVTTFHCTRQGCNEEKTEIFSREPYQITLNKGKQNEEILMFATLEEAVTEAQKHIISEAGEPTEYAVIELSYLCSDVIEDLELPAGCGLFVGGKLTVTGDINLGSSDYGITDGRGAARIFVPVFKDGKTFEYSKFTWKNKILFDGTNTENGIINHYVSESLGPKNDTFELITLFGARDKDVSEQDSKIFEKPWISLGGFYGEDCCFSIDKDFDFTEMFDGIALNCSTNQLVANSDIIIGQYEFIGEENENGTLLVLEDNKSSITFKNEGSNGTKYGFSSDCDVQITSKGGNNTPGFFALGRGWDMTMGVDITVNNDCDLLDNMTIRPYIGDPNTYTVTIPKNVTLNLNNCTFDKGVNVINNGTLNINGNVNIDSKLTNNGSINVKLKDNGSNNYEWGKLNINTGGIFENNGTAVNEGKQISEDRCVYAVIRMSGANLINNINAEINNNGRIELGTENGINAKKTAEGDYEKENDSGVSSFKNEGKVINNGELAVRCNNEVNNGIIYNNGLLLLTNNLKAGLYYTISRQPYAKPETDEEWEIFNKTFAAWDDTEGYFWKIDSVTAENVSTLDGNFTNNGIINNKGNIICRNITLINSNNANINNDAHIGVENPTAQDDCYWSEEPLAGVSYPNFSFINSGTFVNGTLTDVGESENGSKARYDQTYGAFTNNSGGAVTNNGNLILNYVDLTNKGSFETYNDGGFEIRGGTQTVVSTIYNEGYMKVVDEFHDAGGQNSGNQLCNTDNVKRKTQNDSRWIDWTAAVYSEDGITAAEIAQGTDNKYNRMDFCEDLTIEGTKTLSEFEEYWIVTRFDEEAETEVGVKLTVDGTLNIGNNARLNVSGFYNNSEEAAVPELIISQDGKLNIAGEVLEVRDENDNNKITQEYQEQGALVLWPVSGYRNDGTIENKGEFEIYYKENLIAENELSHFGKLHGPHNNSFNTADIRSFEGLKGAVAKNNDGDINESDKYKRITIRENCAVKVNEDITIPNSIDNMRIEPGSGLIVELGSTLNLNCNSFNNDGDITVWGNMTIGENCEFRNHQNLEIGAVSGSEEAVVTIDGNLFNDNNLALYETGNIILGKGRCVKGVEFKDEVILNSTEEGIRYEFENCKFDKDITLSYIAGNEGVEAEFFDSCCFGENCKIKTKTTGTDLSKLNGYIKVFGVDGAKVNSSIPVSVSCGDKPGASCTLNGIFAKCSEGCDFFTVSICCDKREDQNIHKAFQVDSQNSCVVKITGNLSDEIDELRLNQGGIDISELIVEGKKEIIIHDEFDHTKVNIGSHVVALDDWGFENGSHGFEIIADENAKINVFNANMTYDSEREDYMCTNIKLTCNGKSYNLDPHIFGYYGGDNPKIYIGLADENVDYVIRQDKTMFEFEKTMESGKTSFGKLGDNPWFTVENNENPGIELLVYFPNNIDVYFDTIPLKQEVE